MDGIAGGPVRPADKGRAPDPRQQDRTIRALVSVADDLTVAGDADGLLRSTLTHVLDALDAPAGVTFVVSDEGALVPGAQQRMAEAEMPTAAALARVAIDSGEPQMRDEGVGGWFAAAPLSTRGRHTGALVLRDGTGLWPPPGLELLEALGNQIGSGLENARLYKDLRAASRRSDVLNQLMSTLTSGLDLKTVMPDFAAVVAGIQPFDRLACGFVNESGDYIEVTTHPPETAWGFGAVLPVVGSGPGSVILQNRAVVQRDLVHQHRYIEDMKLLDEGIRSYVLLPLNSRGRSVGVLCLGTARSDGYDDGTVAGMQPIADAVAVALENMRLFQKTRELSISDEVTPLFNFRFFHQMLDRELKLVDRYKSVLSVVFMDLDRFKPINDRWGHLRGSRVLREVGFLLRAAVRETDYPARYGGDEFVVILPQTDIEAARKLAEKLRRIVEGHVFLQEEGINATIGMSVGVATYPVEAQTKEALVRLADERMYLDKKARAR